MTFVRWDPWKNIGHLHNRINRILSESASGPRLDDELAQCEWKPAVDILDLPDGVVIRADLPGVRKEDVSVELKDNLMTIKGERSAESIGENQCIRRERCFGSFFRAFTLPDRISADRIHAVLKNGVLEIHLPRPETEKTRQVQVQMN